MSNAFDDLTPESLRQQRSINTHSIKWQRYGPEVLPLWVADMDFPIAPGIVSALQNRATEWMGYGAFDGDHALLTLLIEQQAKHGLTGLKPEHFWPINGVVSGLYAGVLGLSGVGEDVLTQVPIYPPFLGAIKDHGRKVLENPMRALKDAWGFDFDQLNDAITPSTRLLMLCNPHNPSGRVYRRAELERLAEFVLEHRLFVISDELHADLILDDVAHVPFASLSHELAMRTVTLIGPCKSYSTASLSAGMAVSHNTRLLERMKAVTKGLMGHPNSMSLAMWKAGIATGGAWLEEVKSYIRANRDFLAAFLAKELPEVGFVPPEGTYLAWLDFRAFDFATSAFAFMLEHAKVGLNDGADYGAAYQGFLRINLATSRVVLNEALERMRDAVRSRSA